jgi:hypothetical protein
MESPKKRAKIVKNNNAPLFGILDEDSLRQVLLRTCASDHEALRKACPELSRVLDSDNFHRERIQNEWAEVEVALVEDETSSEDEGSVVSDSALYGAPSGTVLKREFCINVDGKKAGDGSVTLISRNTNRFHEICDAISQDLQVVSCCFFDTRGGPRVTSVKDAIDSQPANRDKGFLYIHKFMWDRAIDRDSKSAWLGATAIRSLLLKESRLRGNWTVAIYIPEAEGYYEEEDLSTSFDIEAMDRGEAFGFGEEDQRTRCAEDQRTRDEWQKRLLDLMELDMQQFFLAGFRQVKETVRKSNCYYVFAVPAFLESPMLSSEETAAVEVLRKPADITLKPPTGVNNVFLDFIKRTCSEHQALKDKIKNAPPTDDTVTRTTENYRRNSEEFRQIEAMNDVMKEQINARLAKMKEWLSNTDDSDPRGRDIHQMVQESEAAIQEMERVRQEATKDIVRRALQEGAVAVIAESEAKLTAITSKVRSETSRFRGDGATLKDSNVVHACACYQNVEYLDLLLESAPASERLEIVNYLDDNGDTPLMVAAGSGVGSAETRYRVLEKLIDLGADKNIVDASGETALGSYRGQRQRKNDFLNTFRLTSQIAEDATFDQRLELLLQPSGGPTSADDAYLRAGNQGDDDDNDDDDVDDADDADDGADDDINDEE